MSGFIRHFITIFAISVVVSTSASSLLQIQASLLSATVVCLFCFGLSPRLVGLGHTSALCFVIDTTDYKPEDIGKLRGVTSSIIDSKKGNAIQPLEYILVTFNGTGKFDS